MGSLPNDAKGSEVLIASTSSSSSSNGSGTTEACGGRLSATPKGLGGIDSVKGEDGLGGIESDSKGVLFGGGSDGAVGETAGLPNLTCNATQFDSSFDMKFIVTLLESRTEYARSGTAMQRLGKNIT